jgi:PAS domain S-box-containing protein
MQSRGAQQTLDEFQQVSREQAGAVQERATADIETLRYLRWFLQDDRNTGHDPESLLREFAGLAGDMLAARPGIRAFWWLPVVSTRDRAAYERAAAKLLPGTAGPTDAGAGRAPATLPVVAVYPVSEGPGAPDRDWRASPDVARAMNEVRRTGHPRAVAGALLKPWLEPDQVLVLEGVPYSGPAAGNTALEGYVALVLRADRLTQIARSSPLANGFDVALHEQSSVHGRVLLHARPAPDGPAMPVIYEAAVPLDVAGRRWILTTRTGPAFAAARLEPWSWLVLAGGVLLAALVWSHLRQVGRRSAVVEQMVAERTAALSRTIVALERSEERFRLVTRATNDAISDWDIPQEEVWWNEAFGKLFGHAPGQGPPTREHWASLIHPDDRAGVDDSLRAFFASSESAWAAEYRLRRADGSYAWVFDRGLVVRDNGGVPVRMIGSMMDVTARKEAERMKTDFVSFVTHQLRTPLSGISWMLELAAGSPAAPDEVQSYVADARLSAARLTALVNGLLDISRLESGRLNVEMKALSLPEVTAGVVTELRPQALEKGHEVSVTSRGEIGPAHADAQLIRQVMLNLLSNAIKYTPEAGTIRIDLAQTNGMVEWAVTDTGIGIPPEARGRLFEKFYRAENAMQIETEGTGLGLPLVRLIVERHGGGVTFESEEGRGSTFRFTVPVEQAAP